jgi:hypothetical protein
VGLFDKEKKDMGLTKFPNGASSFGMPVLPGLEPTTGSVFFVHSGTGSNGNPGTEPSKPRATILSAIGLCTADKGDVIIVMPGHAETISGASSLVVDKAGVAIIGLGRGSLRPTLTFTATASIISVTAANVRLENLLIIGDVDNIVTGISLAAAADGAQLVNIEMRDGAANKEFLIAIAIAAACTDVVIDGFEFHGLAGGATGCIEAAGAADRLKLLNSFIRGQFSSQMVDLSAAASVGLRIRGNLFINIETGAGLGVAMHNSSTGFVADNRIANLKDTVVGLSGTGMAYAENYLTNALNASGIILPAVDS